VQWSPDGSCIAVWDGYLQHRVCLYTPEGEYLAKHSADAGSLGVRTIAWAPSGQLLAVAGFDQARVYAMLGSKPLPARAVPGSKFRVLAEPPLDNRVAAQSDLDTHPDTPRPEPD